MFVFLSRFQIEELVTTLKTEELFDTDQENVIGVSFLEASDLERQM